MQPGRDRLGEYVPQRRGVGRAGLLDAGQPEPGQRLRRPGQGMLQGGPRGVATVLARDVEGVADPDAVLAPGRGRAEVQRLGDLGGRQALLGERARGDGQLRVPDVLARQVARRAGHQRGDVGRLADQRADRAVHVREVREVPELEERPELRLGLRDVAVGVPGLENCLTSCAESVSCGARVTTRLSLATAASMCPWVR